MAPIPFFPIHIFTVTQLDGQPGCRGVLQSQKTDKTVTLVIILIEIGCIIGIQHIVRFIRRPALYNSVLIYTTNHIRIMHIPGHHQVVSHDILRAACQLRTVPTTLFHIVDFSIQRKFFAEIDRRT